MIFVSIIIIFILVYKNYNKKNINLYFIIGVGLYIIITFIRISFMIYNDPSLMHDAYVPNLDGNGHLAYILNIFVNHKLPDSDGGVFYHPPLYYVLSSIFIYISKVLGYTDYKNIVYSAKLMSYIIVNFNIYILYKIFKKFEFTSKNMLIVFSLILAHPIFIRFSGFVNNDVLAMFLYILSIYLLIIWYDNPNFLSTIYLAFAIGFGIITKTNVITILPLLLLTMLYKYIKGNNGKNLVYKIVLCIIVSILPFVIWKVWVVLKYGHISVYDIMDFLDIKKIIKYLVGFDPMVYKSIYFGEPDVIKGSIIPYILKTECFMEFTYYNIFFSTLLLFFTNLFLTIYAIFSLIVILVRYIKKFERKLLDVFNIFLFIIMFLSLFYFCLLDARTCTPAFRYIVPIIIPKMYFIARGNENLICIFKNNRVTILILKIVEFLIIIFVFSSIFIFLKMDIIEDVAIYRL